MSVSYIMIEDYLKQHQEMLRRLRRERDDRESAFIRALGMTDEEMATFSDRIAGIHGRADALGAYQ